MARYVVDPLHSSIEFKVKHLMISSVHGRFTEFNAVLVSSEEDFSDAFMIFEADIASITTGVADRDNHLRTNDFFDAPQYPKMLFKSTGAKKTGAKTYNIEGMLEVKGKENPIRLKAIYHGSEVDLYNQTKYGFEITGELSRAEYGLTINPMGGQGATLIDDTVKISISLQMTKVE